MRPTRSAPDLQCMSIEIFDVREKVTRGQAAFSAVEVRRANGRVEIHQLDDRRVGRPAAREHRWMSRPRPQIDDGAYAAAGNGAHLMRQRLGCAPGIWGQAVPVGNSRRFARRRSRSSMST